MGKYYDQDYRWYRNITYYIPNVFKIFQAPLGWVFGKFINLQEYDKNLDTLISKHGFKTNYIHEKNEENPEQDNSKRQICVLFAGNAMNWYQNLWTQDDTDKHLAKHGAVNYDKIDIAGRDVATVYHPVGATTSEAEIECGETLIKKLIKEGYKPENITLIGHSWGGGISAQVLDRFRTNGVLKEGEKFGEYIHHKSFASLSGTATFLLYGKSHYKYDYDDGGKEEIKNHKGVKIVRFILKAILKFFGWELDTLSTINNNKLPVSNIKILSGKNDEVIGRMNAITEEDIKNSVNKDVIKIDTNLEGGHNAGFVGISDALKNGELGSNKTPNLGYEASKLNRANSLRPDITPSVQPSNGTGHGLQ